MVEEQQPIFLVSTGRCGSTFVARSLNKHPELITISELFEPILEVPYFDRSRTVSGAEFFEILTQKTMHERVEIWRNTPTKELGYLPKRDEHVSLLVSYSLPLLTNDPAGYLAELREAVYDFPPNTPANQLLRFFNHLKHSFSANLWIERTGASLPQLPKIIDTWPNAKIIHMFRDGRETACSMQRHPILRMFAMKLNSMEWDMSYVPPLEEFGELWEEWILTGKEILDVLPIQQKHEISFENLINDPAGELTKLLEFISDRDITSDSDAKWIREVSQQLEKPQQYWANLSIESRRKLQASCRRGLRILGYPEWPVHEQKAEEVWER